MLGVSVEQHMIMMMRIMIHNGCITGISYMRKGGILMSMSMNISDE